MPYSADLDVRVTDSSLRDGSHAIRHQFTKENVRNIVASLDDAGVPVIEVTHGDGLGGSSFNYGFSAVPDQDLISTAVATARQAKIAFLMLPGPHAPVHQPCHRCTSCDAKRPLIVGHPGNLRRRCGCRATARWRRGTISRRTSRPSASSLVVDQGPRVQRPLLSWS